MTERQYYKEIVESVAFLRARITERIDAAVFTGTGLSDILLDSEEVLRLPYASIPFLIPPSVKSHSGALIIRKKGSLNIAVFAGRVHYYEGYSPWDIVRPVRLAQFLGIPNAIFLNAAGGLRADLQTGDVLAVQDHIFPWAESPLRGLKMPEWGTRFPDPKDAYDPSWIQVSEACTAIPSGVYVCLPGPQLETKAELLFWKKQGADVVGMSTIPEVLAAHQAGMRIGVWSAVTNVFDFDQLAKVTIEEVVEGAKLALPQLEKVLNKIFENNIENQGG